MTRGEGRTNDKAGKTKSSRQPGEAPTTRRMGGAGTREADPLLDRARQLARIRAAEPTQRSLGSRGVRRGRSKKSRSYAR